MLAKMKAFWLKETDYPNGSRLSRLDVLRGQMVALILLAGIMGLVWLLKYPVAYIGHFFGSLM